MHTLFMTRMSPLPNWLEVIGNAMEHLCTILQEMSTVVISRQMAEKALANGIFNYEKRFPNRLWSPEDSKHLSCHWFTTSNM